MSILIFFIQYYVFVQKLSHCPMRWKNIKLLEILPRWKKSMSLSLSFNSSFTLFSNYKYFFRIRVSFSVSDFVNETVVLRMCTNDQLISSAGQTPQVGCKPFKMFGFVGRGCTCLGECIYPKKICLQNTDLQCIEAIEMKLPVE